ncbi:MAG: NlpC/P60 family protein [Lysobacterales bacterium]
MSIINHRGPIGIDDHFSLLEPDFTDPPLDVTAFLYHGTDVTPGPRGISATDSSVEIERHFSQQVAMGTTQISQRISPVEFADLFHNTQVDYFNPRTGMANSVTIDVHIYNNNGIPNRRANMAEKSALVSSVRRELRRADGLGLIDVEESHKVQIAHCFFGKGNPDEFRVTLMHALRYNRATPANLQRYCDRNAKLGVDCSGFVNTYFKRIGKISIDKHINEYERGTLRSAEDEIRDLDVLIWQGGSSRHIAVIDHVIPGSNPLRMVVVESSGSKGGLATSKYTVRSVSGQIFRVHRGGPGRGTSRVKIAQV